MVRLNGDDRVAGTPTRALEIGTRPAQLHRSLDLSYDEALTASLEEFRSMFTRTERELG